MEPYDHKSDLDLGELNEFLTSGRIPLGFFNLSSLDGFLATVVVGPVRMPPRIWLPLVWNCSEPEWHDQDEAIRVCGTVVNRHDEVARQLADDPDSYTPIFRNLPDGSVAADEWARGFLTAWCCVHGSGMPSGAIQKDSASW